jgi:anti-anti-sigma factor
VEIRTRILPGVVIIDLADAVTRGLGNEIAEAISQLMQHGHRSFVLDLERVSILDSAGLGDIVSAAVIVRRCGGSLIFEGLNPRLQDELELTNVRRSFEANALPDPSHPVLRQINRKALLVAGGLMFLWIVITILWRWTGL